MAYLNATAGAAREATASGELGTIGAAVPMPAIVTVAGLTPAGGTGATQGAYDTSANRDVLIATVAELKAKVNTLLAQLRTAGLLTP